MLGCSYLCPRLALPNDLALAKRQLSLTSSEITIQRRIDRIALMLTLPRACVWVLMRNHIHKVNEKTTLECDAWF